VEAKIAFRNEFAPIFPHKVTAPGKPLFIGQFSSQQHVDQQEHMVDSFLYARESTPPMGLGGAAGASSHNTVSPRGRPRFADGFKVIVQKRSDFSIGGKLLPSCAYNHLARPIFSSTA
jgi:hypothetical protein